MIDRIFSGDQVPADGPRNVAVRKRSAVVIIAAPIAGNGIAILVSRNPAVMGVRERCGDGQCRQGAGEEDVGHAPEAGLPLAFGQTIVFQR